MPQPEDKQTIYRRAQFGHRLGYGKRPAIVVVDLQIAFTTPERSPLAGNFASQIIAVNRLIAAARTKDVPVIFTMVAYDPQRPDDAGLWPEKVPSLRLLTTGSEVVELDPHLQRLATDLVIVKKHASAFFATHLASVLTMQARDTLIVTGGTTSGCIRATVMDALAHGFRPIVPVEAIGDRASEPHQANLFDIAAKYGDVVPVHEVLEYINAL